MTTEPTVTRSQDNSLVGIGAGLVAIVIAGYVCSWAGFSQPTATSVMGLALGVPAAVEFRMKSRHRDVEADIERIQRGELHRPVGLVVMLLAAAIVLLDSAMGLLIVGVSEAQKRLVSAGVMNRNTAEVVLSPLFGVTLLSLGLCIFLIACYASHYLRKRPYFWTATAVACAWAIREIVLLALRSTREVKSVVKDAYGSLPSVLAAEVFVSFGFLVVCMVGAWLGRRYHDAFLAKKLARVQGKVSIATPPTLNPDASQNPTPRVATVVTRSSDVPAMPENRRTGDQFRKIERLAQLRAAGALTEEEFQAKKAELLARI